MNGEMALPKKFPDHRADGDEEENRQPDEHDFEWKEIVARRILRDLDEKSDRQRQGQSERIRSTVRCNPADGDRDGEEQYGERPAKTVRKKTGQAILAAMGRSSEAEETTKACEQRQCEEAGDCTGRTPEGRPNLDAAKIICQAPTAVERLWK